MTAERSSSGVVSCSGKRAAGGDAQGSQNPSSPSPTPERQSGPTRARSHHRRRGLLNRGARRQPAPGRHLTPGARAQGPHLEAAAARPANGRAPPVHHHYILRRLPRSAAPTRRGPRRRLRARSGLAVQVTQHHLQPPHRVARQGKAPTSQQQRVTTNRSTPAQAPNRIPLTTRFLYPKPRPQPCGSDWPFPLRSRPP